MRNVIVAICIILGIFFLALLFLNQNRTKDSQTLDLLNLSPMQQPSQNQQQQEQITPTPEAAGVAEQPRASYSATLKTSKGDIKLTLYAQDAPNTVNNFINKAKSGYYNNLTFHRVEDWVIQGGDPKGNGTGGGDMKTELNNKPFVVGALGVARGGDIEISNDSQFFITKQSADWLNGQYTNFGIVESGMDVVNNIKKGDKILGVTIEE